MHAWLLVGILLTLSSRLVLTSSPPPLRPGLHVTPLPLCGLYIIYDNDDSADELAACHVEDGQDLDADLHMDTSPSLSDNPLLDFTSSVLHKILDGHGHGGGSGKGTIRMILLCCDMLRYVSLVF